MSFVDYYINEWGNLISHITTQITFRSCCDSIDSINPLDYDIGDIFLENSTFDLYVVCEDSNGNKQLTRLTMINE